MKNIFKTLSVILFLLVTIINVNISKDKQGSHISLGNLSVMAYASEESGTNNCTHIQYYECYSFANGKSCLYSTDVEYKGYCQ